MQAFVANVVMMRAERESFVVAGAMLSAARFSPAEVVNVDLRRSADHADELMQKADVLGIFDLGRHLRASGH
jgi:hypothetical protein